MLRWYVTAFSPSFFPYFDFPGHAGPPGETLTWGGKVIYEMANKS